jgi:hypothetical protein
MVPLWLAIQKPVIMRRYRWPASDFKHGKKSVFVNLEEFKWR